MSVQTAFIAEHPPSTRPSGLGSLVTECLDLCQIMPDEGAPLAQCHTFLHSAQFADLAGKDIICATEMALVAGEKLFPCNPRTAKFYVYDRVIRNLLWSLAEQAPAAHRHYNLAFCIYFDIHGTRLPARAMWQKAWQIFCETIFVDHETKKRSLYHLLANPALVEMAKTNPYKALDIKIMMANHMPMAYLGAYLKDIVMGAPEWQALAADGIGGRQAVDFLLGLVRQKCALVACAPPYPALSH